MRPSLRQLLLGIAFLIVYGVVVFAATRAYYLDRGSQAPAAPVTRAPARPVEVPQARPPVPLADDPAALSDQADDLLTQKRYGEAVVAYRKLLDLAPGNVETYNDLGLALFYAGRSGEALEVLEAGAAREPDFQRIWLTLGFVQLQLARVEQAREALETCIEIDPDSPIAAEASRFLARIP
ncbi:MAG: tetratricopeptide repeat protein [Gammaproteobacteria bacterium]|nr:tetratricopeptide repeat protein [Gammaproteobacteria bacterium]